LLAIDNQNFFNIDFFTFKFDKHSNLFESIILYTKLIKELNHTNKILRIMIDELELFLKLNKIDSVEKIDNILLQLEEFSETIDKELEENHLQKWYNYPLRHMIEKVETSNMSLQAMLGTEQALMMDKNETTQNSKI